MKTYENFQHNLFESELKGWDISLHEKASEWNTLDEDTQWKIVEGLVEGNTEIVEEWGPLDEGWGKALSRVAKGVTKLPGIRTVYGVGSAAYRAAKGDWTGAGLSLGSAIPGPVGWGFVAADIGRDVYKDSKKNKDNVASNTNPNPNNRTGIAAKRGAYTSGKLKGLNTSRLDGKLKLGGKKKLAAPTASAQTASVGAGA